MDLDSVLVQLISVRETSVLVIMSVAQVSTTIHLFINYPAVFAHWHQLFFLLVSLIATVVLLDVCGGSMVMAQNKFLTV